MQSQLPTSESSNQAKKVEDPPFFTPADPDADKNAIALGLAMFTAVVAIAVFIIMIWIGLSRPSALFRTHFAAIVGLPGAAAVSFAVVVFLRQTEGPIEFRGLGFEFKGASGQVAMWALCFLVITIGIKAVY
jgi:hypothetical protein